MHPNIQTKGPAQDTRLLVLVRTVRTTTTVDTCDVDISVHNSTERVAVTATAAAPIAVTATVTFVYRYFQDRFQLPYRRRYCCRVADSDTGTFVVLFPAFPFESNRCVSHTLPCSAATTGCRLHYALHVLPRTTVTHSSTCPPASAVAPTT